MLDTLAQENTGVHSERLILLVYGTVWFLFSFWIAARYKLFEMPEARVKLLPAKFLRYMVGAFLVFFFIEAILVPIYISLWLKFHDTKTLSLPIAGWITISAMVAAALGVLLYYVFLPSDTKKIVEGSSDNKINDFLAGVLTWFFAAPIVLIFSQLVAFLLPLFTNKIPLDQTVVAHMRELAKYPLLFWATALGVITIAPIVEEILFRGFLQSWLFDIFGRNRAIIFTSIIFAGFHFSFAQGIFNFELLVTLFLLSCFLGFIYEKRQSIWASIGLHFTFNLIGVIMIAFEGKLI